MNIIGYYAAWTVNSGFTPDKIDASQLTHINYAFANIGPDLRITVGYPYTDPANYLLLNSLKRKHPRLKTLISVGGWTWSGMFSDAAYNDVNRTIFADSCVSFIRQYGFDGVDIDWEFPVSGGLPSNVHRPEDKQNFTLLLQKLRQRLDAQGAADGVHYLLTIAGGSGSSYPKNVEMSLISSYLDFASIMTYDIHGTWDDYTDFNAPLFINEDPSPQYKWSVSSGISGWYQAGFPLKKMMMGIPFYGYLYSSVNNVNNGLYQPFSGASNIAYHQVTSNYVNKPGFVRFFHPQSKVPWLFNGSIFISYDDQESIRFKTDYIKYYGMGGAMAWELSEDSEGILLRTIHNELLPSRLSSPSVRA